MNRAHLVLVPRASRPTGPSEVRCGPILIGYDGSEAAERALREGAALLAPRRALVVAVWEAGAAFETVELPTAAVGLPPVPIDIRSAIEIDAAMCRRAQQTAQHGEALAREAGLEAGGLAVADEISVADTLVRLAHERDAQAIVVGAHGHGTLSEVLLGSTSRKVIRTAPCPVLVSPAARAGTASEESAEAAAASR
jgi:nucleotide-binding universal stress UspA family protein